LFIEVRKAELIASSFPEPALISYIIALQRGSGSSYSLCKSGGK